MEAFTKTIIHGDELLALIVSRDYQHEGAAFLTEPHHSIQLGYFNHPADYTITPHVHKPCHRQTSTTQEVLFIKSGRVRVDFFSTEQLFLQSEELHQGDWIVLFQGGHGFVMLEDSEMIEVKNGPYAGSEDKVRF